MKKLHGAVLKRSARRARPHKSTSKHTIMAHATLTPEVTDVLNRSTITGNTLVLPAQLERKLYEAVNKALTNAGGKWNKSAKGHVFSGDPRSKLGLMLETGVSLDERKVFQAFYTPASLAARMVELADIQDGHEVLEPSAGSGNILRAIRAAGHNGSVRVTAVEINEGIIDPVSIAQTVRYEDFMTADLGTFDRIVMNPPFTKGQDVKHILRAISLLRSGGILVAICGDGSNQNAKLRPVVEEMGGTWEVLPEKTFSESGTNVRTVLLRITKP